MATILKTKLTLSAISISVISLIPLLESNFNADVTIKRYGKLSWDDFRGIPKPLTRFDAAIHSSLYMEYDSVAGRFHAFAGQNNMRSWVKDGTRRSMSALRHEQYHFNATEVHARKMNEFIQQNPGEDNEFYYRKHYALRLELNAMQDQYDNESDHSQIMSQQSKWEYKIDSLLIVTSGESGKVQDHFSGASGFFTESPGFSMIIVDNLPVRIFTLEKYRMILGFSSFQITGDPGLVESSIRNSYDQAGQTVVSITLDSIPGYLRYKTLVKDTTKENTAHIWISRPPNLYRAGAIYPATGDVSGYREIAASFLDSFRIENQDDYWIQQLKNDSSNENSIFSSNGIIETISRDQSCLTWVPVTNLGFYWGPVWSNDGSMMIVMDPLSPEDNKATSLALSIGKMVYRMPLDAKQYKFVLTAESVPAKSFHVMFGYLMNQSPKGRCEEFRHQVLYVERH